MQTTKLKIDLPDADELTAGLDVHTAYPKLTKAEQKLEAAETQLAEARQQLTSATTTAEELPARVRAGQASPLDLEAALVAQRAAALSVPTDEDVQAARGQLEAAQKAARKAVGIEASKRLARLQHEASKLVPVLGALHGLELSLVGAAVTYDEQGVRVDADMPALTWPASLKQERQRRVTAEQMLLVSSGLTAAEYAQQYGVGGRGGVCEFDRGGTGAD